MPGSHHASRLYYWSQYTSINNLIVNVARNCVFEIVEVISQQVHGSEFTALTAGSPTGSRGSPADAM